MARFRALPERPREVWQGGFFRLPGWVAEPGERPTRAIAPLWVSLHTGMICLGTPARADELDRRLALDALVDFATNAQTTGYRPGKLEVNDAELAETLTAALAQLNIAVVHRDSLLAFDRAARELTTTMTGGAEAPGPLDAAGVTLDRLRSFAEAAKAFFLAAPWRKLEDVDLLRIESAVPDSCLRYVTVLGAAGETFGLGFFESQEDLWRIYRSENGNPVLPRRGLWHVAFDPLDEIPQPDADLWLDNDLPVACEQAYPYAMFMKPGGTMRRATPRTLAFLEGVLRALADSDDAEIDQGRWSKEVMTADGPACLTLSLPDLLEPPDPQTLMARGVEPDHRAAERWIWRVQCHLDAHPPADQGELDQTLEQFQGVAVQEIEFKPATSGDQAQDLCYQAFEVKGRRRLQIARQALAICPDCPDAHSILAERRSDPLEMLEHFEHAVEAGQRSLGPEAFEEDAGHFWSMVRTRPYMRALLGLARTLEELERTDEAIEAYQTMLRLNPEDHQGARYSLLALLIVAGRDDDAASLIRDRDDEPSPVWPYARALLAFRNSGDTAASRRALKRALSADRSFADALIDDEDVHAVPAPGASTTRVGRRVEGLAYSELLGPAWDATDGAIEWLIAACCRS